MEVRRALFFVNRLMGWWFYRPLIDEQLARVIRLSLDNVM